MDKQENSKRTGENVFIRIINILYGLGWLCILIAVVFTFFSVKPYQYVDYTKSHITCLSNNSTYTYSEAENWVSKIPNNYQLNLNNIDAKAGYLCEKVIEDNLKYRESTDALLKYFGAKAEIFSENDQKWFPNNEENRTIIIKNIENQYGNGIYEKEDVYSTHGNWGSALMWVVGVFAVLSIILDLLRAVLLYLVTGKKMSISNFTIIKLFNLVEAKKV